MSASSQYELPMDTDSSYTNAVANGDESGSRVETLDLHDLYGSPTQSQTLQHPSLVLSNRRQPPQWQDDTLSPVGAAAVQAEHRAISLPVAGTANPDYNRSNSSSMPPIGRSDDGATATAAAAFPQHRQQQPQQQQLFGQRSPSGSGVTTVAGARLSSPSHTPTTAAAAGGGGEGASQQYQPHLHSRSQPPRHNQQQHQQRRQQQQEFSFHGNTSADGEAMEQRSPSPTATTVASSFAMPPPLSTPPPATGPGGRRQGSLDAGTPAVASVASATTPHRASSGSGGDQRHHQQMSGVVEAAQTPQSPMSCLPSDGGYPVTPVQSVSGLASFICAHCKYLLRDPMQSPCGHRFCSSCYHILLAQPQPKCPDPGCEGGPLEHSDFHDMHAARDISALQVYCVYQESGCTWQGQVKGLEAHLSACTFTTVQCPNDGCTLMLAKHGMEQHARDDCPFRLVVCEYCRQMLHHGSIQTHQNEQCPELPVDCKYLCGSRLPRCEVSQHNARCSKAPAKCSYVDYGCACPQAPRDEIIAHEREQAHSHLGIVFQRMKLLEDNVYTLVDAVKDLQKKLSADEIRRQCVEFCQSPAIAAGNGHYATGAAAASEERVANLEAMLRMQSGELEKLNDELLRQSRSGMLASAGAAAGGGAGVGMVTVRQLDALDMLVAKQSENMSDLSLRMDILDVKSTSGVLIWKISDLQRRLTEARQKKTPSLYSAPFYTSGAGYKMCCRVYLDGDGVGRGSHLSIFFVLMQGNFDNLLTWPFPYKVSLLLLNQDESLAQSERHHYEESFRPGPNSAAFEKPRSAMNTGTGCPKFAPKEVLDTGSAFVRNDSICIKIAVSNPRDTYKPPDCVP